MSHQPNISFIENERNPKMFQSRLTNMLVSDLETQKTDRTVRCSFLNIN